MNRLNSLAASALRLIAEQQYVLRMGALGFVLLGMIMHGVAAYAQRGTMPDTYQYDRTIAEQSVKISTLEREIGANRAELANLNLQQRLTKLETLMETNAKAVADQAAAERSNQHKLTAMALGIIAVVVKEMFALVKAMRGDQGLKK